jgi:hypothetical protein
MTVIATAASLIDLLVRGEAMTGATLAHYRAFEPDAVQQATAWTITILLVPLQKRFLALG